MPEEIAGVVYPVPSDLLERIFTGKDVFIKHPTCFKIILFSLLGEGSLRHELG